MVFGCYVGCVFGAWLTAKGIFRLRRLGQSTTDLYFHVEVVFDFYKFSSVSLSPGINRKKTVYNLSIHNQIYRGIQQEETIATG